MQGYEVNYAMKDLGERKAIEIITKLLRIKKLDDCAKITLGNKYFLITTDMLVRKSHLLYANEYQIGWQSIAVSLSDLACKGGLPIGLVVALGLPDNFQLNSLKELIRGMNDSCKKYGTKVIGGDTKPNRELTIVSTALGIVNKKEFISRIGANVNDFVAVTGTIGDAACGYYSIKNSLKIIEAEKEFLLPKPRVKEGIILAKIGGITSSIDTSDGLASSITQLSELNNIGFEIEWDKLPLPNYLEKISDIVGIQKEKLAIDFGGEYELLFTFKQEKYEQLKKELKKIGTELTCIGRVVKNKKNFLIRDGKKIEIKGGYEHWKR
ncbi:MAG: thiamine-phosphate kinase [Candidatus Thermoplasmatota archaeon]